MVVTVYHLFSHGIRLYQFVVPFAISVVPGTLSCPGGKCTNMLNRTSAHQLAHQKQRGEKGLYNMAHIWDSFPNETLKAWRMPSIVFICQASYFSYQQRYEQHSFAPKYGQSFDFSPPPTPLTAKPTRRASCFDDGYRSLPRRFVSSIFMLGSRREGCLKVCHPIRRMLPDWPLLTSCVNGIPASQLVPNTLLQSPRDLWAQQELPTPTDIRKL